MLSAFSSSWSSGFSLTADRFQHQASPVGSLGSLLEDDVFNVPDVDSVGGVHEDPTGVVTHEPSSPDSQAIAYLMFDACDDTEGVDVLLDAVGSATLHSPYSSSRGLSMSFHSSEIKQKLSAPRVDCIGSPLTGRSLILRSISAEECHRSVSSSVPVGCLHRSKPISVPRKGDLGVDAHNSDSDKFIPPHELTAMSGAAQASCSWKLKGSAALKLRSGLLRKTGYYDGYTETAGLNTPKQSVTVSRHFKRIDTM